MNSPCRCDWSYDHGNKSGLVPREETDLFPGDHSDHSRSAMPLSSASFVLEMRGRLRGCATTRTAAHTLGLLSRADSVEQFLPVMDERSVRPISTGLRPAFSHSPVPGIIPGNRCLCLEQSVSAIEISFCDFGGFACRLLCRGRSKADCGNLFHLCSLDRDFFHFAIRVETLETRHRGQP